MLRDGAGHEGLPGRAEPRASDVRDLLVEARHEPLLELRGAELVRRPAQPLRHEDLNVEGTVVPGPDGAVPDALTLEEGIGAIDGTLDDSRCFFGAQASPFELFGASRDAQADDDNPFAVPFALGRLEPLEDRRAIVAVSPPALDAP